MRIFDPNFRNSSLTFLIGLLLMVAFSQAQAQTIFWVENFDTACSQGQLAPLYGGGSNGSWTVDSTGANGLNANVWYVSATEAGTGVGNCGASCLTTAGLNNRTLHIGRSPLPPYSFGDSTAIYDDSLTNITNLRVVSPIVDCSGQSFITVEFEYIEGGQDSLDGCTFWYSPNGGTNWGRLDTLAKTPPGCPGGVGQWVNYSVALPTSADNNPNVQIGFTWTNNGDSISSNPSFAVDSIRFINNDTLFADFTASNTTICAGQCIGLADLSNGDSLINWFWTFPGADSANSTLQFPTNICYSTPGVYDITLTVTDSNGTFATLTIPNYITVNNCPGPVALFTTPDTFACINQCIDFTDFSTPAGAIVGWEWNFDLAGTGNVNPPTSIVQNPTNICYAVADSFDVQLIVTDTNGFMDTLLLTDYIIVDTCVQPVASFTSNLTTVCVGDCVQFTDLSTGTPTGWAWSFGGGSPSTSTAQNPNICFNTAGTFPVELQVTNFSGTDDTIALGYITVLNCPLPQSNFSVSSTSLCPGDCLTFFDGSAFATGWIWNFPGATPSFDTAQNPINICYPDPGQYDVTLIVTNSTGSDTLTRTMWIDVDSCLLPIATVNVEDDSICVGECVQFFGPTNNISTYEWEFFGADSTYQISTERDPYVCFSDTGKFGVKLTVENPHGADIFFVSDFMTVGEFPTLQTSQDTTVIVGYGVQIVAFGTGSQYFWQPYESLSCFACPAPSASPEETTMYVVTNTTDIGCSVQDSVEVVVDLQYFAGVPNIFSPNGDDNNDLLFVRGNGIGSMEFKVFSRYGQKVFETRDQSVGWDGKFKGKDENPGVFTYYARVTFLNGATQELKGNVTLIR